MWDLAPLGSEDAADFRDRRIGVRILLPAVKDILSLNFSFLNCKTRSPMITPQRGCKKQR